MRRSMLRQRIGLLLAAAALLLSGCGINNAEEFRKAMRSGTPLTTVETLEVERPFKEVTATLRSKSKECLDVTVRLVCTNCISNRVSYNVFKPTFVAAPNRTELHLQFTT